MSIEVKVPVLAESVSEASLLNWYKQPGDMVKEGDKLVDVETDKVVLEVVAPKGGMITEILRAEGEKVNSEEVIAKIDETAVAAATKPVEVAATSQSDSVDPKTSPAVRKIAAEQGVDPASVPHSGDRVTKADMLKVDSAKTKPAAKSAPTVSLNTEGRQEQRVPMTRLRKRVSERLLQAQQEHAILTTFNEINMKPVMDLRSKYKEIFEKEHNARLGFMSFFVKAAVLSLQKFPVINASTEGEDIIYHGYFDIGIAVSSPRGLVVPILRNADALTFAEIEKGIADFGKRAKNTQLTIEDLTGGTFSITNGGIFGSMMSTPILNPPQSAILGMHNIVDRAWVENGQVVVRPVMYVALSYDHRIIDGSDAVSFLFNMKKLIEDPARLLLEV